MTYRSIEFYVKDGKLTPKGEEEFLRLLKDFDEIKRTYITVALFALTGFAGFISILIGLGIQDIKGML